MMQFVSIENHPEVGFSKVLTTTYKSGAQSKRYHDKDGIPFDLVWLKPLNFIDLSNAVIDSKIVDVTRPE